MRDHDRAVASPAVLALARAIASAEGFGRPGAIPTLANNPGDLVIPGWTGAALGPEGISVFGSEHEGWLRLYHQLQLIADRRSHVYTLGMSILDMAARWTDTQRQAWADNVVRSLTRNGYPDVTTATLLGQLMNR